MRKKWIFTFVLAIVPALHGADSKFRLAAPTDEAAYRKMAPRLPAGWARDLIEDPATLFYTEKEMPRLFQFQSPNLGWQGVHDVNVNIGIPGNDPVANWNREFPWDTPFGCQDVRGLGGCKFVRFSGPMVYWEQFHPGGWLSWTYKHDTVFGEILTQPGPKGEPVTFEMRVRVKDARSWAPRVFRPYPTAADLAEGIDNVFPDYQSHKDLVALKQHLDGPMPRGRASVTQDFAHTVRTAFRAEAKIDVLPAISADKVKKLLDVEYREVLPSATWRGEAESPAAPTATSFHVVPAQYAGGFVDVSRDSCLRCHRDTNQDGGKFQMFHASGRVVDRYGQIRGSGGVFSFQPIDRGCCTQSPLGAAPVIRRDLLAAGLIERYDPRKHPDTEYRRIDGVD